MYNPKIHKRKSIRLKGYDYSQEGYYFITICTEDRKQILSKIDVGVAVHGDPQKGVILSKEGKIVKRHIENCNKKIINVSIDKYVIMPNHVHLIIVLRRVAQECDPYNF